MKALGAVAVTLGAVLSVGGIKANAAGEPLATRPGLEVGVQAAHYEYEEPGLTKLVGNRGGILGAYTFTDARHVFSRIEARESYGRLKYEKYGSGNPYSVPDFIFEARAVAGKDLFLGGLVSFSPYAGLGYRYLYDDLRDTTFRGAAGYRRESNYVYAPLGLTTRVHLGGGLTFAPTVEVDYFLRGQQRSRLSDTGAGTGTGTSILVNRQNQGRGYRAKLMFETGHWAVGGWMNYWRIGDSEAEPAGFEPANRTREGGLEFSYRF